MIWKFSFSNEDLEIIIFKYGWSKNGNPNAILTFQISWQRKFNEKRPFSFSHCGKCELYINYDENFQSICSP